MARRNPRYGGRRKMGFGNRLLFWITIQASVFMIASWACTFVDPGIFWPAAFIAMIFPVLLLLNIVLVIIWLLKKKFTYMLLALVPVLLSWNLNGAYLRMGIARNKATSAEAIELMSFNVHAFDKNNYYVLHDASSASAILEWVADASPDIICMQEFYSNASRRFNMLDSCMADFGNPHFAKAYYRDDWHTLYLATFSEMAIGEAGKLRDARNRSFALWTDIDMGDDTIRLINTHLRSNRLADEMDVLETSRIAGEYADPRFRKDVRTLLAKMKRAFVDRSAQTRQLSEFIGDSPYPVVLCGDLNDTPASYTYRKLSKGFRDTFKQSGRGIAGTYSGRLPSFRIDYILIDKRLRSSNFRTHKLNASDHYPITVNID